MPVIVWAEQIAVTISLDDARASPTDILDKFGAMQLFLFGEANRGDLSRMSVIDNSNGCETTLMQRREKRLQGFQVRDVKS